MLRIRIFEEVVADLILDGTVKCPTHLYIGQEAIAVGVCTNLRKDDYVFPTYRSHGAYLSKGGCMNALMAVEKRQSSGDFFFSNIPRIRDRELKSPPIDLSRRPCR